MDQNVQFIITVGAVIGGFLLLRHDINQINANMEMLNDRIDKVNDRIDKVNENHASMRESLGWIRGRMGFTEQPPANNAE